MSPLTPGQRHDRERIYLKATGGTLKRVYNALRTERDLFTDPHDLEVADRMMEAVKQVYDDHMAEVRVSDEFRKRLSEKKKAREEEAAEILRYGRQPKPPPPRYNATPEEVAEALRGRDA